MSLETGTNHRIQIIIQQQNCQNLFFKWNFSFTKTKNKQNNNDDNDDDDDNVDVDVDDGNDDDYNVKVLNLKIIILMKKFKLNFRNHLDTGWLEIFFLTLGNFLSHQSIPKLGLLWNL